MEDYIRRGEPRKWAISRPKNGISLNGREYLCDENGKFKLYNDINTAMLDLAFHGYDMSAMKREGIEIVEMQENGDYYEPIREGDTNDEP